MLNDQGDRGEWGRLKAVSVMVEIRSLHNEGLKNKQIAARLGIHRETVAKYLKTGEAPAEERGQARSRKADKYREYMQERLTKFSELSAEVLYREIRKGCSSFQEQWDRYSTYAWDPIGGGLLLGVGRGRKTMSVRRGGEKAVRGPGVSCGWG